MTTLDLRHLPPPQPMQRILHALENAAPESELCALTPLWPAPLIDLLRERGIEVQAEALAEGGARLRIRR